jgi:tRNA 2-thiouridine synthesizing protein A
MNKPSIIIDAKGLFCPVPIVKVAEAIRNIDSGMLVEIISDDAAIRHDMPAWCKSTGNVIEAVKQEGNVYRYLVRKK